jgi:L-ascorbate metabolism protein UlaG (beta-lactamase superfamily)
VQLGGTTVLGIMVAMDAEQRVEVQRNIEPKRAIPINYSRYDVFKSPLADFQPQSPSHDQH